MHLLFHPPPTHTHPTPPHASQCQLYALSCEVMGTAGGPPFTPFHSISCPPIDALLRRQTSLQCQFYAFDCEMTGLFLEDRQGAYLDDIEDRYQEASRLFRSFAAFFVLNSVEDRQDAYFHDIEDRYEKGACALLLVSSASRFEITHPPTGPGSSLQLMSQYAPTHTTAAPGPFSCSRRRSPPLPHLVLPYRISPTDYVPKTHRIPMPLIPLYALFMQMVSSASRFVITQFGLSAFVWEDGEYRRVTVCAAVM